MLIITFASNTTPLKIKLDCHDNWHDSLCKDRIQGNEEKFTFLHVITSQRNLFVLLLYPSVATCSKIIHYTPEED